MECQPVEFRSVIGGCIKNTLLKMTQPRSFYLEKRQVALSAKHYLEKMWMSGGLMSGCCFGFRSEYSLICVVTALQQWDFSGRKYFSSYTIHAGSFPQGAQSALGVSLSGTQDCSHWYIAEIVQW